MAAKSTGVRIAQNKFNEVDVIMLYSFTEPQSALHEDVYSLNNICRFPDNRITVVKFTLNRTRIFIIPDSSFCDRRIYVINRSVKGCLI